MPDTSKTGSTQALLEWIERLLTRRGLLPVTSDLAEAVSELSAHFNGLARLTLPPGGYMADPRWRDAYLAYFFPANAAKAHQVLHRIAAEGFLPSFPNSRIRILDFGSGPASAALGAGWFLRSLGVTSPEFRLVDQSRAALQLGIDILRQAGFEDIHTANGPDDIPPVHMALAFNVLNELEEGPAQRILGRLLELLVPNDGRLLIVEPALRETSRRLLQMRDSLISEGRGQVLWPCRHAGSCPGIADERDWCHGSEDWDRPKWMAEIDKLIGNRKERLNHTSLWLSRAPVGENPPDPQVWRVVSDPVIERGKRILYLCGGPSGERVRVTLLDRHINENTRAFADAGRYDLLRIEGPWTEKGDGFRLGPENEVGPVGRARNGRTDSAPSTA